MVISTCRVVTMRVQDEELWSLQMEEFGADEMSRKFRDFLVFWCETAEKLLDSLSNIDHQLTSTGSLKRSFEIAEQTFGYISVDWLGQMLLVVIQHWADGPEVWESLSVFERRMVEQATAIKLTELQEIARVSADQPGETND